MKKFIKGRWFPLAVVVAAVLVISLILFLCGFRITYAPKLESSWDAVSAVATWAGVFASVFAIIFAIRVPKKIAEEQNKIALFEKRYEMFSVLSKWKFLSENIIKYALTNTDARAMFAALYNEDGQKKRILERINIEYLYIVERINQVYFLFDIPDDMHQKLIDLINLITRILIGENLRCHERELIKMLNSKEITELFNIMQTGLTISQKTR